ncbi:MAG: hypothetical protein Unbinned2990contig1002_38 [Prokaryotic dsDNA virus sp.]|nr:MAG: hypothetical protein Unbinned2990contig1002_38 [Prokaryotic dsDNA virus sp.]
MKPLEQKSTLKYISIRIPNTDRMLKITYIGILTNNDIEIIRSRYGIL